MKLLYQQINNLLSTMSDLLEFQKNKIMNQKFDSVLVEYINSFTDGFDYISSQQKSEISITEDISGVLVLIIQAYERNEFSEVEDHFFSVIYPSFPKWSEEILLHFAMNVLLENFSTSLIEYYPEGSPAKKIVCFHDKSFVINFNNVENIIVDNLYFDYPFNSDIRYITFYSNQETLLNKIFYDLREYINCPILPNLFSSKMNIETFDLLKYLRLNDKDITIISDDCWGAYQYKQLGLKYNTPFIWLFISLKDFFKLLNNIHEYVNSELSFIKLPDINYPVAKLRDITIHFNHYHNEDEAREKWIQRVKRMNRENMVIKATIYTREEAIEFEKLPFNKKVCFTPEDFGVSSNIPMTEWNHKENQEKYEFYQYVHLFSDKYIDTVKWLNGENDYRSKTVKM